MNPPSQPAPQTRAFQSWQLVFIAVMLLAAAVTSGLYIATVQAESNGAITGLTLTSDAPGTLMVSWARPAPRPPTTGSTGPSPPKSTSHGRSTKVTNTQPPPPRP